VPSLEGFVKVRLRANDDTGPGETVWAESVGNGRFRIDNVPWLAYGVSLGDIVEASEDEPGQFDFVRVVEPSGNRAVRVVLSADMAADTAAGRTILEGLQGLGCTYEGANRRFIGVTVPAEVSLQAVADYLLGRGLTWEYANPTYAELFGE
jgi:hypothetical protein